MLRLLIGWQEAVSDQRLVFEAVKNSSSTTICPRVICYIAMEIHYGKSPFIVDLPIKNGDLPWFFVNVYQRVGGFNAGVMGRPLRWGACEAGTFGSHIHMPLYVTVIQ